MDACLLFALVKRLVCIGQALPIKSGSRRIWFERLFFRGKSQPSDGIFSKDGESFFDVVRCPGGKMDEWITWMELSILFP